MPFGASVEPDGRVRFLLWAPGVREVTLELSGVDGGLPMQAQELGWHQVVTDRARPGSNYRYRLPNDLRVPDPASRHQPVDVH